ncbi:MAG: hypothetical protein HY076_09150 [Candidatus Eisenbacteria bacterium]|uniref:Outer membrane protein beta-barrel domain-containing protein n=1 Tax=Eiseniibacteriota bacterium TaxID=2212470 RepID=A0A9D6QKM5_UNCEI|nr:hypothetical protein [Candidatus Eisenbacteria bacterium]MBI3540425.1 hypothetical protein [Candidatus Eisenbacteria bacterium]
MKHAWAAALALAAIAAPHAAVAQVFGQFNSAATLPVNGHAFGGYLTASQNQVGGLAQLRLSFYPDVDFGFHGGLSRLNRGGAGKDITTLRLGTDVRWQLRRQSAASAVDVSAGAALAVETGDAFKVVTLGPTVVVGRTVGGENGPLAPYAGLALLFVSRDAFGLRDTDLSLPLRLGLEARLAPEVRIVAEMQVFIADRFNDDVGFATGVNLPF